VNYVKLLELHSFFNYHFFLEVGKTQDLPSKIWQTLGDALRDKLGSESIRDCTWRWREPRKAADSGIYRGSSSEVMHGDIHEPTKKQSQSCRPKKSGF
jgi:hypothetical protein